MTHPLTPVHALALQVGARRAIAAAWSLRLLTAGPARGPVPQWRIRLVVHDIALSRRNHGFESRIRHLTGLEPAIVLSSNPFHLVEQWDIQETSPSCNCRMNGATLTTI